MEMISFSLNGKNIEVPSDSTVLQIARQHGLEIPTMCHLEGHDLFPSCMVCVVKDNRNGRLFPSCTTIVQEGMEVITNDEEVFEARKTGLELLLSDHVGDCEAPCQTNCPAYMDIPLIYPMSLSSVRVSRAIRLPAVLTALVRNQYT